MSVTVEAESRVKDDIWLHRSGFVEGHQVGKHNPVTILLIGLKFYIPYCTLAAM